MSDAHSYARQDFDPILDEIIATWPDLTNAVRETVLDAFKKAHAEDGAADAPCGVG